MHLLNRLRAIPRGQKYRYGLILLSCMLFFSPFVFLPGLAGNEDLCGPLCMRRFYLYFPGMSWQDLFNQISLAWIGVIALFSILLTTLFFGRMWCAYLCPVGGFPELVSRTFSDRWKIEYRHLPQVPIRYGYFAVYLVLMPVLGVSACTLCNFMTVPRLFESFGGGLMGLAFIFSTVGLVNLALLFLLGFLASKGRAYCQFLCPIGAIDGLVNRLGAMFRFTRRIRVERSRCTGCNICARNCMTGAIKMVDRIAVVDQLSCMSCHECVDVCDWGAIDWLSVPPRNAPRRRKKGVDFHPLPHWEAVHVIKPKARGIRAVRWSRVSLAVTAAMVLMFIILGQVHGRERHSDPDGCLSCHALRGLEYIDKQGVLRDASIDTAHYYASLHGSVPCKDCHRQVRDYPHREKNTAVDCAASCHVEEPSEGEAYTHKAVVREYRASVHGKGKSKGFTGGNRLRESRDEQNPSCRKCHSNTLYIDESRLDVFREAFAHTETECGTCHEGKVWLNQFGGHILRRFIGARWTKQAGNAICNDCHQNRERMSKARIEDRQTGKEHAPGPRFIHASDSYAMTLHGRLLRTGLEQAPGCLDCHAPSGLRHGILAHDEPGSPVHEDNLARTCGRAGCHEYADHALNSGFLATDMHDLDMIPLLARVVRETDSPVDSGWFRSFMLLAPLVVFLVVANILHHLLQRKKKHGVIFSRLGGDGFQQKMIGRNPRHRRRRKDRKS